MKPSLYLLFLVVVVGIHTSQGAIWHVSVFVDSREHSESSETLLMDVQGTKNNLSEINLGNNFQRGEIRQIDVYGDFGKITAIRLYQRGEDGICIEKVVLEDEDGRPYTFFCNFWIQTDQPANDSKPSWTLNYLRTAWRVSVFIGTREYSESSDTLLMDVKGTSNRIFGMSLGNNFRQGEIRQMFIERNFGKIDNIRLYQSNDDGIRVRKVVLEDDDGRPYTFECDCWIQTDQPADDSKPSWTLHYLSAIWHVSVFIGNREYSDSSDTLLMEVQGTMNNDSEIRLGNHFRQGEIRRLYVEGDFGKIKAIRLYQTGNDGIRVRKVVLEDEDGRPYTFECDCWIQTDQLADDSKPSWTLHYLSAIWHVSVFVGLRDYSDSIDTLLMDIHGTANSLSKINLGNNFLQGEIRRLFIEGDFGKINTIRLYRRGNDWIRVRRVILEDENGRPYTFRCGCYVPNDQQDDNKPSRTLNSRNCYWNDSIPHCAEVVRVSCQTGKCNMCNEGYILQNDVCRWVERALQSVTLENRGQYYLK